MFRLAWAAMVVAAVSPAFGQSPEQRSITTDYIKSHFTKYEYRIPMRDGKRLFTAAYLPKEAKGNCPILLTRTPYSISPYGPDQYPSRLGPAGNFLRAGYIFVNQDVRGRYMSEGTFVDETPHRPVKKGPEDVDESTDTYDTIDWLTKHVPHNNGNVGLYGISYGGFYAAAGIIDAHPALKAASPQAPMGDEFLGDDAYHNGAFCLAANFGFFTMFKQRTAPGQPDRFGPRFDFQTGDGYEFYLNRIGVLAEANRKFFDGKHALLDDVIRHTTYDEFWQSRAIWRWLKGVKPAILTVGGWFDAEDLAGPFHVFNAIEKNGSPPANILVMGPWSHGGWASSDGDRLGPVQFNAKTSQYFQDEIQLPFFDRYLKGKSEKAEPLAKAYAFETGTNVWRRFDAWPPPATQPKTLYFRASGKLAFEPPAEASASDEYVADPNKPVPFIGFVTMGVAREYMTADQRFAAMRSDVLTYATPPLEEDIVVAGPLRPVLHVSSTGTDSDFVVKLIDVYPDQYPDSQDYRGPMGGYQQLVRGEPVRAKFRDSLEKPEPLPAGKIVKIAYTMPAICHSFRRSHRIMVQVQSSWFPLIDRNPQQFMDIPTAREGDFRRATQRVSRSKGAPSGIEIRVVQ